jgi:hypothetical protein
MKNKGKRIEELEAQVQELSLAVMHLRSEIVRLTPQKAIEPWKIQNPQPQPYTAPMPFPQQRYIDCGCPANNICGNVMCPRRVQITS